MTHTICLTCNHSWTTSSLQSLTNLSVPLDELRPAALHFLLSQLCNVPGLTSLDSSLSSSSELKVCTLSRLPHLTNLPVTSHVTCSLRDIIGSSMDECFQYSDEIAACFNVSENGRQRFFDILKSHLTESDRVKLERWDAGDYSLQ